MWNSRPEVSGLVTVCAPVESHVAFNAPIVVIVKDVEDDDIRRSALFLPQHASICLVDRVAANSVVAHRLAYVCR